jgi:DNA polymerase-3 subunit epsilon
MSEELRNALQRYFNPTWVEHLGWENARFIVLDSETTGFDERSDRLVSIGAVSVYNYEVFLDDAFDVLMPIAFNTSAVTVHGITREASEERGEEEPVAIERFLHFLRDGIIVGHHIRFDLRMIGAAVRRHFGDDLELRNLVVDTMDLTLWLEEVGALPREQGERPDYSLDGLCRRFNIAPHDRHTAMGDAFLTAQIFLVLLRRAKKAGLTRLGDLTHSWVPPEERGEKR